MLGRVIVLSAVFLLVISSLAIADAPTHESRIVITGSSQEVYDYQVRVVVPYQPQMQPDFRDIRFVDDAGAPLDHWLESHDPGSEARYWVRLPPDRILGKASLS